MKLIDALDKIKNCIDHTPFIEMELYTISINDIDIHLQGYITENNMLLLTDKKVTVDKNGFVLYNDLENHVNICLTPKL